MWNMKNVDSTYISPQLCWQLSQAGRIAYLRRRLLHLLEFAWTNVPFYRDLALPHNRLETEPLQEILDHCPIITKRMMQDRNPRFLASQLLPGH
jgi:phenylacetate-coenzyme A ligase PaaK-like adenylate-forming protein